jgi:hypothetical protein
MTLKDELDLLAPRMRTALLAAVQAYDECRVPFALCGGLAAGTYGSPRATRDIDFLVGDEAFLPGPLLIFAKPLPLMADGVAIDAVPLPEDEERHDLLARALQHCRVDHSLGVPIPILAPEWLAYMKTAVGRAKDKADVIAMLESGSVTERQLRAYVKPNTPMASILEDIVTEWRRP